MNYLFSHIYVHNANCKTKLVLPHSIMYYNFYMYQILLQPCMLLLLALLTRRKMEGNDEYFTPIFYSMKIVKFDHLSLAVLGL